MTEHRKVKIETTKMGDEISRKFTMTSSHRADRRTAEARIAVIE